MPLKKTRQKKQHQVIKMRRQVEKSVAIKNSPTNSHALIFLLILLLQCELIKQSAQQEQSQQQQQQETINKQVTMISLVSSAFDDDSQASSSAVFDEQAKLWQRNLELIAHQHKQQQQQQQQLNGMQVLPANQAPQLNANRRLISSSSSSSSLAQDLSANFRHAQQQVKHEVQQREHMHLQTTYACDGNQLDINCAQEGKLIHVARANYGRFSLSMCNEFGHSNLSVQCQGFRAFLIMENKCNTLSNCSVIVSKDLFGDPCEGTSKYLEVQYYCYDANNQAAASGSSSSTSSAGVAQIAQVQQQQQQRAGQEAGSHTSTAPSTNNQQASDTHKSHTTSSSQQQQQQQVTQNNNVGGNFGAQSSNNNANNNNNNEQQPSLRAQARQQDQTSETTTVIQQQQQQQQQKDRFCSPQASARNYFWNYTKLGQFSRQNCPDGFSGQVSWFCDPERALFTPILSPDFTQCNSNWLHRLNQQLLMQSTSNSNSNEQQQSAANQMRQAQSFFATSKMILNDLALMTQTKELFSSDLKRIHSMLSQILYKFKFFATNHLQLHSSSTNSELNSPLNSLGDELFNKWALVVSNLFDLNQKSAWLEVRKSSSSSSSNQLGRQLESQYLDQLKEAAAFLLTLNAQATEQAEPQQAQQLKVKLSSTVRHANLAGALISVIDTNKQQTSDQQLMTSTVVESNDNNELTFSIANLTPFSSGANSDTTNYQQTSLNELNIASQVNELRINTNLMKQLLAAGVTRFLLLEVKKPDFELMEQQLESSQANTVMLQNAAFIQQQQQQQLNLSPSNNLDSNLNQQQQSLFGESQQQQQQQWSSRVFGVIPLVEGQSEKSGVAGGKAAAAAASPLVVSNSLSSLLAQWPISVDFKLLAPTSPLAPFAASSLKQCTSLTTNTDTTTTLSSSSSSSDINTNNDQQNRCHTLRINATNVVCRCDQFGFIALANKAPSTFNQANQHFVPGQQTTIMLPDFQWPSQLITGAGSTTKSAPGETNYEFNQQQQQQQPNQQVDFSANQWSTGANFVAPQNNKQSSSSSSMSIWTTIFIVLGLSLLAISLGAFLINTIWRASSQCKLDKKKASFFAGGIGGATGPTTGPLPVHVTDHNLMSANSSASNTDHSAGSVFGLAQSVGYHGYKSHQQQLYAAHLPPIELCGAGGRWSRAINMIKRPTRWLSHALGVSGGDKDNQLGSSSIIQHRIIGSSLTNPSSVSTYKSQYQNGYTTNLHPQHPHHLHLQHQHQQQQQQQHQSSSSGSQMPLAALSSSTSSYVSSSAYYEEIGQPANQLTKVNPNQQPPSVGVSSNNNNRTSTHTIVDPFRRQQANNDQQQLLLGHQHHQHHHLFHHTANTNNTNANWSTSAGQPSYSSHEPLAQLNQQQQSLGQPFVTGKQLHNDLNGQLQQQQHQHQLHSSSGSSSANSSSTAPANGSTTPKHYLFASPSAVNAYKSSMVLHQQQQQHQQQPVISQHHLPNDYLQPRFMQS